jgi:hypothetical protein
MGSEEDPTDGAAVAASVFGAVAIYGVRSTLFRHLCPRCTDSDPGLPRLLRRPSLFAPTRQIKRCYCLVIDLYLVLCSSHASQALNIFGNLTSRFSTTSRPNTTTSAFSARRFCFFLRRSASYRHLLFGRQSGASPLCIPIVYLMQICSFPSFPISSCNAVVHVDSRQMHQNATNRSKPNFRNHHHFPHRPWALAICSCTVHRANIRAWRSSCVLQHQK